MASLDAQDRSTELTNEPWLLNHAGPTKPATVSAFEPASDGLDLNWIELGPPIRTHG
jgi:hypothetical protein